MPESQHILFVINNGAGNKKTDWQKQIEDYFQTLPERAGFFSLPSQDAGNKIRAHFENGGYTKIVSVGGDGTFAIIAKAFLHSGVPIGLLSAGSANGMATGLNIPRKLEEALEIILHGHPKVIDAIDFNGEPAFHMADVGLNALIIKYFDESRFRGLLTYGRMLIKALFKHSLVHVTVQTPEIEKQFRAYAVIFANGKKYGTGANVNPDGELNDHQFELVIVQKLSLKEIIKLFSKHKGFDSKAMEIISAKTATLSSRHRMHHQRDGEYLGKTKQIHARVIRDAVTVMIPPNSPDL